jgi:hypothetical protein
VISAVNIQHIEASTKKFRVSPVSKSKSVSLTVYYRKRMKW